MQQPQPTPDPSPARSRGYEADLMPRSWLWKSVGIFAVLMILILWALAGIYRLSLHWQRLTDRPGSAITARPSARDAPPMQPSITHDSTPAQDMRAMRQAEDAIFARHGWAVREGQSEPRVPDDLISRLNATSAPTTLPIRGGK